MEEILASIRKIISDDAPNGEATDVVELTQMVQDDGSVVDAKQEEPMPEPQPQPVQPAAAAAPAPAAPAPDQLVSEKAATAATSALSALASTVQIEKLAAAPMNGTALGNGSRTLEDMVIELMRPLLKEWLDQNLPATVDRLVQKEIERIARKAQD